MGLMGLNGMTPAPARGELRVFVFYRTYISARSLMQKTKTALASARGAVQIPFDPINPIGSPEKLPGYATPQENRRKQQQEGNKAAAIEAGG
jgi:hypothetical protein